ncbi:MAG: hypothetical protein ACO4CH_05555 [Saprospiraceae bacterium]
MEQNIAFLELKYGNIYGGPPNFFAISEVALLVFEPETNRIFLESLINNADIDIVNVYNSIDDLGTTTGKIHEVFNMRTHRRKPFDEAHTVDKNILKGSFNKLHPFKKVISSFFAKKLKKYNFDVISIFDGRRDVFLCEKNGVKFYRKDFIDLQHIIRDETNYLFSLNKLTKVINFSLEGSYLRSNNLEYWLHPIAAKQIVPKSAAYDASRMLIVYQEYSLHHDDFLIKAALQINKIEQKQQEEE